MKRKSKYSPEVQERAVRLFFEQREEHRSRWAAIESIAGKIGCNAQTLSGWIEQHEIDSGAKAGVSTTEVERVKALSGKSKSCGAPTRF
jgi:transposase